MNAKDIVQFSENAIALLQGDGGGLGPMLDSTQKLTKYAKNRQQLISTLTGNLARITESMGGRNENVIGFLQAVDEPMSAGMTVLDEFAVTASAARPCSNHSSGSSPRSRSRRTPTWRFGSSRCS